jgi:hypothetical protein
MNDEKKIIEFLSHNEIHINALVEALGERF